MKKGVTVVEIINTVRSNDNRPNPDRKAPATANMIEPKTTIGKLSRIKDIGSGRDVGIRLDKNERTVPFADRVFEEMMSSITSEMLPVYPNQDPLYKKLAQFLEIDREFLLLSPGSDASLKGVFEAFVEREDEVITIDPTYAMAGIYAQMFGARDISIAYADDLKLDFEALIDAITENTRLVYIANPNQPTGTIVSPDQFEILAEATNARDVILVVDQAYEEFSEQKLPLKYASEYDNLIFLRTFSKAFGLASLRLGYSVSAPSNTNTLYKVKTLADINLFALHFADYLLENYSVVEDYVQGVRLSKKMIKTELEAVGATVISGHANFAHIRFPEDANVEDIANGLRDRGYLVRVNGGGLPAVLEGCIRVTVGPPDQMAEFLEVLKKRIVDG